MASIRTLSDLVSRWRELRQQGRTLSPEDLHADCPELLADPTVHVEAVAFMEDFLSLSGRGSSYGGLATTRPREFPSSVAPPVTAAAPGTVPMPAPGTESTVSPVGWGPGGFEVLSELGRGGMGVVYKARQVGLNRLVALKMIRGRGEIDEAQLRRFRLEAESVARLRHPNIVQVYEIGEHEGQPFFAMEFVPGGSLDRIIHGVPQPPRQAAQVLVTLAEAMHHAHEQGIVHRDLKPANILLQRTDRQDTRDTKDRRGEEKEADSSPSSSSPGVLAVDLVPKITDFGLAKQLDSEEGHTRTGAVMGTPSYMAPEQASGNTAAIGPWTDVWALGAVLYELLTGRPPFRGEGVWDTIEQVRSRDPVAVRSLQPRVPRDLETICLKCLRKEPFHRYHSARELAEDLQCFLDGRPIKARPAGLGERVLKWARRRPALATLAVVVLLSLLGAAGLLAWHSTDLADKLEQRTNELRDTQEKERLATERAEAERWLREGQTLAVAGRLKEAEPFFAAAVAKTRGEPALRDLHSHAVRWLNEFKQEFNRETTFTNNLDTALASLMRVIARDPSVDREKVLEAARKALEVYGIRLDNSGGPVLNPLFFDDKRQERIAATCYELLLILALAEAPPALQDAEAKPPTQEQVRRALAVLDRAGRMRMKSRAELGVLGSLAGAINRAGRMRMKSRAFHLRRARLLETLEPGERREEDLDQERELARSIRPAGAVDFFLAGHDMFTKGQFEQALRNFTRALDERPDHFWAQYFRALCRLRVASDQPERAPTHLPAAEADLTACVAARAPGGHPFVWSYIMRGFARAELRDFDGAEKDYAEAEKLPRDPLAEYAFLVNRGFARARQGRFDDAVKDLRQAAGLNPNFHQAHFNLARVYHADGKLDEALAAYGRALAADKQLVWVYRQRARLHLLRKDTAAARADLDEAIRLGGKGRGPAVAEDYLARARLRLEAGQAEEALRDCRWAVASEPRLPEAYRLQGKIQLDLGRLDRALQPLKTYLRLSRHDPKVDPVRASVYRALAGAQAQLRQDTEAIAALTHALALEQTAGAYADRGWLYVRARALDLAQADFDRALQEDPDHGDAYNGRAFLHVLRRDHRSAAKEVEEALRRGPDTWQRAYNAARVLAQASVLAERDPRLSDRARLEVQSRYQNRAVELVRRALALRPPGKFWKDVVQEDPALRPIRQRLPAPASAGRGAKR